ncbi:MAG: solute carrier family 23 protein, partial [Halorhabdus sp.]
MASAQYDITPLVGAFIEGLQNVETLSFALIVFTFFFVDFFDTAGTLVGVGQAGDLLDEDGNFPDIDKPLMADAIGTTVGGILGTSTVTTYIESATGVEEGGRTGMTALVVGVLFLLALIVVPLATIVPQYASHIALVVVALLMLRNVVDIQWDELTHAVPAGLTIIIMPLTYSIAYGIAAGIVSYPVLKAAKGEGRDVHVGQWILAAAFVVYFVVRTGGILETVA